VNLKDEKGWSGEQKLRSGQLNKAAQTATEIGLDAVRERERQHNVSVVDGKTP